jgi:hypothetical protein
VSTTVVEQEAPPEVPVRPAHFTNDVLVEKFVALRDKIAEKKKEQQVEIAKYNLVLNTLEGWMLDELNRSGAKSIATENGTFFRTVKTSVTVEKWQETLQWIKDNDAWDLLEARVSKTALDAVMQDLAAKVFAGTVPNTPANLTVPGVKITKEQGLNVRRA